MSPVGSALAEVRAHLTLTDSGIETDVIFGHGRDLPGFAVFPLLGDEAGVEILARYYGEHLAVAAEYGSAYVMETPSWRSSPDWGRSLGYAQAQLDDFDRAGVALLDGLRESVPGSLGPVLISGLLGPRGDGYQVGTVMTSEEAHAYHRHQVNVLADAGVDIISACTLTYPSEAVGVALGAREAELPAVIYVTVETDGRMPDGTTLLEAIEWIDDQTDGYVAYYGINCAHPDHMAPALADGGDWVERIGAIRANASRMSHAELDEAAELDSGDPAELASDYLRLREALPQATVFGGCCGTDVRHVRAIAEALSA